MSSPYINHFIQADSVLSEARYAYVGNNPINRTDPSGHATCDEDGNCFENGRRVRGIRYGVPDPPIDPVKPTTIGRRGTGAQMKLAYERLAGMCGLPSAWWCSSTQTFTLRDFMIMVLKGEFSPFVNPGTQSADLQSKLVEAGANWFSDSCLRHPNCAGPTPNAIFNCMGENLESGIYLFTADPTEKYLEVGGLASAVADAVLSVGSKPSYTPFFGELVHWGNKSYYEGEYGKGHFPTPNYQVLGGDAFYIIPYSEEARICGAWPCP